VGQPRREPAAEPRVQQQQLLLRANDGRNTDVAVVWHLSHHLNAARSWLTTTCRHVSAAKGDAQTRHGIWNIENLDFEPLLREKVYEFLFVWSPLKIVGATGSPGNPVAIW
jgi:kynurenine formamidase